MPRRKVSNCSGQNVEVGRLAEIGLKSSLQSVLPIRISCVTGQRDGRSPSAFGGRSGADFSDEGISVFVGQADIAEQYIRLKGVENGQCFPGAWGRTHSGAVMAQGRDQKFGNIGFIFDHKNEKVLKRLSLRIRVDFRHFRIGRRSLRRHGQPDCKRGAQAFSRALRTHTAAMKFD